MGEIVTKEIDKKDIDNKEIEDDQKIVVTMRCIDMASPTPDVDRVPCSECGEMTWLSRSLKKIKADKIICNPCFRKSDKYNEKDYDDYRMCVTEECLNDAFEVLRSRGIDTTKEEMIRRMEKEIGRKLVVTKIKEI